MKYEVDVVSFCMNFILLYKSWHLACSFLIVTEFQFTCFVQYVQCIQQLLTDVFIIIIFSLPFKKEHNVFEFTFTFGFQLHEFNGWRTQKAGCLNISHDAHVLSVKSISFN
jgi:hypothetical protein